MITKIANIEGQEITVYNKIIKQITNDIMSRFIKDFNAFLYLKTKYDRENVEFPDYVYDNTLGGPTLDIEYEIKPTEELAITTSYIRYRTVPIVLDKDNGFSIRPLFRQTEINLHYRFRSQSKQELLNLKSKLLNFYYTTNYVCSHNLEYSFLFPYNVIVLANEIKTLKGLDIDVIDYLNSIAIKELDAAVKRGSEYKIPVYRGKQMNRYGSFKTNPENIEITRNDVPEYIFEFDYRVTFDNPISLFVQYPILINNKPLSKVWLGEETFAKVTPNIDFTLLLRSWLVEYSLGMKNEEDIIFKVPNYDNFALMPDPNKKIWNINFLSLLIEVDKDQPDLLFNLDDLKYIGLPDNLVEYMKRRGSNITRLGKTGVLLELYEGNNIKDLGLYVDENNNVRTKEPMNITKVYHIIFKFIIDLSYIDKKEEDVINDTKKLFKELNINIITSNSELLLHKYGVNKD